MQESGSMPDEVSYCCSAGMDLPSFRRKLDIECFTASSSPGSLCWLMLWVSSCAAVTEEDDCFLYACRQRAVFHSHTHH